MCRIAGFIWTSLRSGGDNMTMLSHYTRPSGLQGISQSQSLWATDFLSLNDTNELTYGMEAIMNAAISIVVPQIPRDLRNDLPDDHVHGLVPQYIAQIRQAMRDSDGYDSLYVTSFARGRNEHEEQEGILTLWREYTQTIGYCLQYQRDKIRRLINTERTFFSYGLLDVIEVQYGINADDPELRYLAEQYALILLEGLARNTGDPRFMQNMPQRHAESHVIHRLLMFCAKHKNPSFDDEREVRIIALPLNKVLLAPFRPTTPKTVHTTEAGTRYIALNEHINPGLRPDRIIIGPNAELNEENIAEMFPHTLRENQPAIFKSTIPVRAPEIQNQ